MSAAETEDVDAPEPEPDTEDEEVPEIESDEMADLSAVADEIEEAAGAGAEDQEDETDDSDEQAGEETAEPASPTGGVGWGEMYVRTLDTSLSTVVRHQGGEIEGTDPEAMARDLGLDEAVDEWAAERDMGEMDPGQQILFGSLVIAGTVLVTETDFLERVADDVVGGEGDA